MQDLNSLERACISVRGNFYGGENSIVKWECHAMRRGLLRQSGPYTMKLSSRKELQAGGTKRELGPSILVWLRPAS